MTDLDDVVDALKDVEKAVKSNASSSFWGGVSIVFFFFIMTNWIGDMWNSKIITAVRYGTSSDNVQVQKEPHDCDFLEAPLGRKPCRYVKIVSMVKFSVSTTGNPIQSFDDGKTWETVSEGSARPRGDYVVVSYTKHMDDEQ
jgi:hypothetical protein